MRPPELAALQSTARSEPSRDLWGAAAVRETYRVDTLLADWLRANPNPPAKQQQEAVRAALELQSIGIASTNRASEETLRLPEDTRSFVLSAIGAERSRRTLGSIPEDERTMTERALAALLANRRVPIDRDDRMQLSALQTASEWARAAGIQTAVTPESVGRSLQRVDFLQSLGGADLPRFVGRVAVRRALDALWRTLDSGPKWALIEGAGGVGKSLAIGRFIADVLESNEPTVRPDAVFHLDFDRLSLQRARVSTILGELIQQGRRWSGPERVDQLAELSQHTLAGDADLESVGQFARSNEAARDETYVVHELLRVITGGTARARIIFFVDTFEQVELFDDVAADSPRRVIEMFVMCGATVLAIYASRAFVALPTQLNVRPMRLRQFTVREADAYLTNEASRVGLTVSPKILTGVRNAVGRSPLALRLAVGVIEKSGSDVDLNQWGVLTRDSPELVQAALYDRLLRRIRDPELRKIAVPGLLVRRLTASLIAEVLAVPCGLDLAARSGDDLMAAARKEGQLFVRDEADEEGLRHRQDVRATMLANLDRSTDATLARVINENAVRYYASREGSIARTEELYHRLRLEQSSNEIDPRWSDEAGMALRPVREELPSAARAYLRRKLGAATSGDSMIGVTPSSSPSSDPASSQTAKTEEFRLFAKKVLQSGGPVDAILARWQAEGMRLDVPLGDIYAEALVRKGWHEQLLSSARELRVASTQQVDRGVVCAVMSISAALLEGRNALSEAQPFWSFALESADPRNKSPNALACLVGSVRIRRKLGAGLEQRAAEFEQALAMVDSLGTSISRQRVLAREVVAELSEALVGKRKQSLTSLRRLLEYVVEVNEAFPSAVNNPARVEEIGRRLFGATGHTSIRSLNSDFQKLSYGGDDEMRRIVSVLREEVDWSLAQASVGRGTNEA